MRWGLKFKPLTGKRRGDLVALAHAGPILGPTHFHRRIGHPDSTLVRGFKIKPLTRFTCPCRARGRFSPPVDQPRRGAFHVGLAGLVCQTVPGRVTLFQMADDFLSDNRLLKTPN